MLKCNRNPDTIPTTRFALRLVAPLLGLYSIPAWAVTVPAALSAADVMFYTIALTTVAFFSFGMMVSRQYQWLTYSIYGVLIVMLIAALDGTLSYLFGGYLWLMTDGPLLIGAVAAGFGFAHVAYRFESGHWLSGTRSLHLGFAALMLLLLPAYWLLAPAMDNLAPLYATLNTGVLIMLAAQIFPPITWTQFTSTQRTMTVVWPVSSAGLALGFYAIHFSGDGFARNTLNLFNRLLLLLHLSHLLVFAGLSVVQQMRARVLAEQAAAESARSAAEAALALEVSERGYERARNLASRRSQQLASASHDLQQPVMALRQVVEQRADRHADGEVARLKDAIDYLDQLVSTYLNVGNRALDESLNSEREVTQDGHGQERLDVNLILDTVAALYQQSAHSSRVALQVRHSALQIQVHPLALTRVLSNLVANALAHGQASRILLCARRRSTRVRIEIHDNGCGMNATELTAAMQLRHHGEDSGGSGLGLAIVQSQAHEQDWGFEMRSRPGRGTSAYVTVAGIADE